MKVLFLTLLLLCSNAFAFDSSSAYNVVAMSFPANQMIFNRVVLDAAQKAQTSVTFTADVQNGGGRPTHTLSGTPLSFSSQTDSAFIRMRLHDAAGTLINTVTSPTYTLRNLGSDPNNQFSTKPGDNLHPWTLASVTYTGDLSNVRFIQLEMVGTDGAFWAGNYGPMWRVPTVTFGADATNTVYNPEFGIAPNSVRAQGWFNSSNTWAVCGVTSGNVPCVTSVAGVNANMWGGGYDINGGSLAGAVGGYDGTLSSTTADNAAATGNPSTPPAPPPPNWQPIRTTSSPVVISNIFPTSNNSPASEGAAKAFDGNPNTKYLNFDKKNAGVTVKLSQGRVVQKFTLTTANDFSGRDPTSYKLYGSNDGVNWVLIKQDTVSLSEQRFWTSPDIMVSNTNPYVYYFILFPTTKSGDGCGLNCDSMQIAEVTFYYDLNDGVTSTESGSGSTPNNPGTAGSVCADCGPTVVGGTITQTNAPSTQTIQSGGTYVNNSNRTAQQTRINTWANNSAPYSNAVYVDQIGGNNNNVTISLSGSKNRVDLTLDGAGTNTVNLTQVGSNYLDANVIGYQNSLITNQTNSIGTNYAETTVSGNNNTANHTQSNSQLLFSSVNGNNNTLATSQTGTGQHYLDVRMTGNGHNVNVNQFGSTANNARIDVTNAGGAATVELDQNGGKNFTLIQSCGIASGCNTIVKQQ